MFTLSRSDRDEAAINRYWYARDPDYKPCPECKGEGCLDCDDLGYVERETDEDEITEQEPADLKTFLRDMGWE